MGRWMHKCTTILKNEERNILSNSHNISEIQSCRSYKSSNWRDLEHNSLKNWLSSVRVSHTLAFEIPHIASGKNCSIIRWQSWISRPNIWRRFTFIHVEKLDEYPSSTLSSPKNLQIWSSQLKTMRKVWGKYAIFHKLTLDDDLS